MRVSVYCGRHGVDRYIATITGCKDDVTLIGGAPGYGARCPGFHTLLVVAAYAIALSCALTPAKATRSTTVAWIRPLSSRYQDVYPRHAETSKVQIYSKNFPQSGESRQTADWLTPENKAYIQEFLEIKANRHDELEQHSDVATQYLKRRLSNIINDVSNDGIVAEFGLNRYKSFTYILDDSELVEQVVGIMRRYHENKDEMSLFGEPIAIKDNIAVKGINYTNGSALFEDFKPSYSAHVVEQLQKQGAIIIGKTAMDEFGVGSQTKGTLNPFGSQYVPGGSSGGSASAVRGGIVRMALGTDTGGSIRLPAAYCGCVGYRPSYGLLSRYGLSELAARLDVVGICTETVRDAIRLAYAIMSPCYKDATSSKDNAAVAKELLALLPQGNTGGHERGNSSKLDHRSDDIVTGEVEAPLKGMKIASLDIGALQREGLVDDLVAANVREVEKTLGQLGAQIVTVDAPPLMTLCKMYHVYVASQIAANLQRFADRQYHPQKNHLSMEDMMKYLESETSQRLKMGVDILQEGHDPEVVLKRAKTNIATWLKENGVFSDIPLLIMPSSSRLPPKVANAVTSQHQAVDDIIRDDIYTVLTPIIGACSVSVPSGMSTDGLPFSVQFNAAPFNDVEMLKVAMVYEEHLGINAKLREMVEALK